MADIVNLRQARKQKALAARDEVADRNRVLHGRSKAEKQADLEIAEKTKRFLDGHRRDKDRT